MIFDFSGQQRCYETGILFFYKATEVGWFVFVLNETALPDQGVFPYNLGYLEVNGRKSKGCAQNWAAWRGCKYISCLVEIEAVDNNCNLARNQFAKKESGKMLTFLGFYYHFPD